MVTPYVDRMTTSKFKIAEHRDYGFVPGTPEFRVGLVWSMTKELISLGKRLDAEQRLQRHTTRLIRRKG